MTRTETWELSQMLLAELEQEAQTTRRVLQRVPEGKLSWRPHPRSFSLGQLALHVATIPRLGELILTPDQVEPPEFVQPEARTTAEISRPWKRASRRPQVPERAHT